MKLDLSELAANLGKSYHYDIREKCSSAEYIDLNCVAPIVGFADFTNTGDLILARGKYSTKIEMECGRCLGRAVMPIDVTIEEEFLIANLETGTAGNDEESDEEEEEPLFRDNIFDLSEFIRQTVLVETPIRPLCCDDCKGLCPSCGKNLNEGPCDCPTTIQDSPFSVLQQLLEDDETTES